MARSGFFTRLFSPSILLTSLNRMGWCWGKKMFAGLPLSERKRCPRPNVEAHSFEMQAGCRTKKLFPHDLFFCTKTWFSGHLKQAPQTKERYHLRVRPRKPQNILHFDLGQVGSQLLVGLRQKGLALLNFLCQPWVVAKKIDNLSGLARWISSL